MPGPKRRQLAASADISMLPSRPRAASMRNIGPKTFFRPREAAEMGVDSRALRRMVDDGSVERVARGLYRVAEAEPTEHYTLAAVCARVPSAIVCLLSALSPRRRLPLRRAGRSCRDSCRSGGRLRLAVSPRTAWSSPRERCASPTSARSSRTVACGRGSTGASARHGSPCQSTSASATSSRPGPKSRTTPRFLERLTSAWSISPRRPRVIVEGAGQSDARDPPR